MAAAPVADPKLGQQIDHDIVVIAGVKRDFVTSAAVSQRARHIQCSITIERRDLYSRDVFDLEELAPEAVIQRPPADRRLQVETAEGNDLGHAAAMPDQFGDRGFAQGGEAQQSDVVAGFYGKRRFMRCLRSRAADACDFDEPLSVLPFPFEHCFQRKSQYRLEQTDTRIANRKLRGMYADGHAARPGVAVIARQGALPPFIRWPSTP